jgi:hypothetical protein
LFRTFPGILEPFSGNILDGQNITNSREARKRLSFFSQNAITEEMTVYQASNSIPIWRAETQTRQLIYWTLPTEKQEVF